MASNHKHSAGALEIDRLALRLAKDPDSKVFLPLAEEYCKAGMWQEAAGVLEDGLKYYPGFITAMVALGRAYDQLGQPTKAKAILEEAVKQSPENLRAHRTLIKIYIAEGQAETALKSCDVILRLNPRDEEALSAQAKLGRPSKEEGKRGKKPVTGTAPTLAVSPISPNPSEETEPTSSPIAVASTIIETALQADTHKADEETAPDPSTERTTVAPSPHADTIAQLEAWLRSIERERRDRSTSDEPHSSSPS